MIAAAAKRVFITAMFMVLTAPLFIVAGVSINAKKVMFFPPMGVSLKWYPTVFEKAVWYEPLTNSFVVAALAGVVALSVALPCAYFLWRYKVAYAKMLFALGLVPFALPPVITALGMLVFWGQWLHYAGHIENIIIGHGIFLVTLPLVMISLGLESIEEEILEAARTMGADSRKVFFTVVLPLIRPYLFAGYAFVFVVSLNEYIIAFFLGQSATVTLPVQILASLRSGYSPVIASVSVMFILLAIVVFTLVARFSDLPKLLGSWETKE